MTIDFKAETDPMVSMNYSSYPLKWQYIIVHHTGAEEKDAEQIRRYHKSLGWRDIGYHFVIERDGKIVVGRTLAWPGAHCTADGMNFKGIGVALIGNFNNHPPLPAQVDALKELLSNLRHQYGIPIENQLGHKQVRGANTVCPGDLFPYDVLRQQPFRLFVNGKERKVPLRAVDGRSQMQVGNLWVPIVPVVQALGGSVRWIEKDKIVDVRFS